MSKIHSERIIVVDNILDHFISDVPLSMYAWDILNLPNYDCLYMFYILGHMECLVQDCSDSV